MGWEGGSGSVYETSILNLKYIYIINSVHSVFSHQETQFESKVRAQNKQFYFPIQFILFYIFNFLNISDLVVLYGKTTINH
jgi:hypothetical protein